MKIEVKKLIQMLLALSSLFNFICWTVNFFLNYTQLCGTLSIMGYFALQILCYSLLVLEQVILYQKISNCFLSMHIKWLLLIFRSFTFLNLSINSKISSSVLGETLEIIQEFYVILKLFDDPAFRKIQFNHIYLLIYVSLVTYCRIVLNNPLDWIYLAIIIFFISTLKAQQIYQTDDLKDYLDCKKTFSPQTHDTKNDSIYGILPIQIQLANSRADRINSITEDTDFFEYMPFGLAIVDTKCMVKYSNSKLMNVFQVPNQKFLERALQTIKIQKLAVGQNSYDSTEHIQQMEIKYDVRQRSLSFFQQGSQNTFETLDSYLNVLCQEFASKRREDKMVFVTNIETKFIPLSYVIGIYPCQFQSYQSQTLSQSDFMLFFFDMNDYQTIISRQISLQLMNQMFKSFSHEFGTSLNCISSLAQFALDTIKDQQILDSVMQPIFSSSLIMCSIVQDMRDFNLFLSQSFEMKVEENVNLIETVNKVKNMFDKQLQHKNIYFKINMERKCKKKISTDQNRLHQILVNLVSNAQKNTAQGYIEITIQQWTHQNLDYIKFEVKDSGVGIQQNNLSRLEDLLNMGINQQRYNNNKNQTYGFGLLISNLIVQSLGNLSRQRGGGIQFTSEVDKGSTFSFLIYDFTQVILKVDSEMNTQSVGHKQATYFSPLQKRKNLSSRNIKQKTMIMRDYFIEFTGSKKNKKDTRIQNYFAQFLNLEKESASDAVPLEKEDLAQYQSQVKIQSWKVRNPAIIYPLQGVTSSLLLIEECKCNDVLIVDDEYFNITALQALLKSFGVQTDFALCGKDAMKQYENRLKNPCPHCKKLYTLIFMDINMPQMDGFVTSAQLIMIANEYQVSEPTIVAQTAFSDYETEKMSFQCGMKFFMTKPLQKKELKQILLFSERVM